MHNPPIKSHHYYYVIRAHLYPRTTDLPKAGPYFNPAIKAQPNEKDGKMKEA